MRRFCLPFLIMAAAPPASAQTVAKGHVSGVVLSDGGQPLAAAQIVLRNAADSNAVRGTVSNNEGRFLIDGVLRGTYNLRITFVGYKPHNVLHVVLTDDKPSVELGTMTLTVAPIELTQLDATAAKSPVVIEADRTIHDTRDMVAAKGGKAIDVLRAIPELEVDINGKVTTRGNQTVTIQFNGRPAPLKGDALASYLQQMPGDRIAKVEVIPNPGARYDPEGPGGIVNIVLKDNIDLGLSGNLTLNGSTRLTRGGGLRINYQKGRLALFTGGNINFNNSSGKLYDLRRNLLATPVTLFQQDGTQEHSGSVGYGDVNMELKVGKQATVWLNGSTSGSNNRQHIFTAYEILAEDMVLLDTYNRSMHSNNVWRGGQASTGFKQVFVPNKHELSIELYRDFGDNNYENNIRRLLQNPGAPIHLTLTDADQDNRERVFTFEYTRPLSTGKLEAGTRISGRRTGYDIAMDILADEDVEATASSTLNNYDYREQFNAAYVTINRPVKKFSLTAGLRAELATTDFRLPVTGDEFHNEFRTLFPSAAIAYDFGAGTTLRFNYSKRIGRPSPDVLNPYMAVLDPLNRQVGNPHLEPTYTHSFNADVSKIASFGTLRLSTYYRHTIDQWMSVKHVDSLGVSLVTWKNLSDMQTYGFSALASLKPGGSVSGAITLNGYREVRDAANLTADYVRSAYRWSASGNSQIKLNEATNAQLSINYRPSQLLVQGRMSGMLFSSVGLRRQLMDRKASLNLNVTDPFSLFRYEFVTNDRTHEQVSQTRPKIRQATLSFTYNWGKPPQQQARRSNQDNNSVETVQIR